jgi:endonuclease IV
MRGGKVADYLYGQHVQGGQEMVRGLRHAIDTGATAAQVFPGNQLSYDVCKRFTYEREMRALADQLDLTVHAAYFVLITQEHGEKRDKSIDAAVKTLQWADDIGAKRIVIHPGSTKTPGWSVRAQEWLLELWNRYDTTVEVCLETMAGKTALGNRIADLASLCIHSNVGICVDTTHTWSAGWSIDEMIGIAEKYRDRIKVCHFNVPNQGVKCGSALDRHNHGFHQTDWTYHEIEALYRAYKHVPCILEGTPTPLRDYELLRRWQ